MRADSKITGWIIAGMGVAIVIDMAILNTSVFGNMPAVFELGKHMVVAQVNIKYQQMEADRQIQEANKRLAAVGRRLAETDKDLKTRAISMRLNEADKRLMAVGWRLKELDK